MSGYNHGLGQSQDEIIRNLKQENERLNSVLKNMADRGWCTVDRRNAKEALEYQEDKK